MNFLIQFGPHLVPVFVVCACDVFGAPIPTPHYTFQWLLDPFSIENKRIYNSNTNLPRRNGTVGTKRDARPQQYNNVSIYLSMSLYIYIGKHDLYPFLLCSISGCCAAPHYMDQQENVSGSVCLFTCVFIRHSTMHTSRCFPHISVWMCGGRVRGQPTSPWHKQRTSTTTTTPNKPATSISLAQGEDIDRGPLCTSRRHRRLILLAFFHLLWQNTYIYSNIEHTQRDTGWSDAQQQKPLKTSACLTI